MYDDMAQSMQVHVFLTSIGVRPFQDLKIEAGLTSLNKNHEAVVEMTVLTHFLLERGRY